MTKKKPTEPTYQSLAKLAADLGMPDGALDGDLQDAADEEAQLIYELIKDESLEDQLEFLYLHGFQMGRLEEIIREYAAEQQETE